jgi:toxin HigB-1
MEIGSIRHKALRGFALTGQTKGLPGNLVTRLTNMLAWLAATGSPDEFKVPPNYGAHQLTGDRNGTWAMTVTRNWRLTFEVSAEGFIENMDLEDYH